MAKLPPISLGDLITETAAEIRRARNNAPKDDPVIALTECELTLAVTVSAELNAGVKVWLLDFSGKATGQQVSTITLKFGPVPGKPPIVFLAPTDADEKVTTLNPANRREGETGVVTPTPEPK